MLGAMRPRAAPICEASAIRGLGFRVDGRSRIVRNAKSLPSTHKEGIQQSGLSMDHRRLWSLAIAKASFAQLIKKKNPNHPVVPEIDACRRRSTCTFPAPPAELGVT